MKIATFNINNVNKRLANLLAWLRGGQARRGVPAGAEGGAMREFPKAAIEKAGYRAAWRGQKSWNGVAILARGREPIVTRTALPGDPTRQRRAATSRRRSTACIVASLYAPNGNPQPGPKFTLQARLDEAARRARRGASTRRACRWCWPATTTSCRPTRDIYPTKSYAKNALVQPESRAAFRRIARPGLGRCDPHAASRRADVHVLGLHAEPLAARRAACGSTICCSAPQAAKRLD